MSKAEMDHLLNQAETEFSQGRHAQAGAIAERVLKMKKTHPKANCLLGRIAYELEQHDRAATYLQKAIAADRREPFYHLYLATVNMGRGRLVEAVAGYDKALRMNPAYDDALAGKAEALERSGKRSRAIEILRPRIRAGTATPRMALAYVRAVRAAGDDEAVIETVQQQLERPGVPDTFRRSMLLVLGRSYDRMGDIDRAFEAFSAGNQVGAEPFDIEALRRSFDLRRSVFSPERMPTLARAVDAGASVVLVVGMPRSGSTLIEQIIHAHPAASGAGETHHLGQIALQISRTIHSTRAYPECVLDMTPAAAESAAAEYMRRLQGRSEPAERIVDKSLENHTHLGLAAMILPRARVIHARRNPLGLCFSNFMHDLSPKAHSYASDLRDLGHYYREYDSLMRYWAETLDIAILDVDYEAIVADQEAETRRIIDFIGLPWDDACLRYFEAKRDVVTISYDQVTQPIYNSAAERHRLYERHLGPLREVLGECAAGS